jgi:putative addiction module component (TIGR02574 family)
LRNTLAIRCGGRHRRNGMISTLQDLKTAAASLPVTDRAELAEFLLRSLDDGQDADARTEWLALAERRMADVKAGKIVGIPADEVLRSLPGSRR